MSKELSSAGQASVMSMLLGTFFRVAVQEVILASAVQVLVYGIALPCPRRVGCPGMACRGRGRAAVYSGLSDRPFCNVIPELVSF